MVFSVDYKNIFVCVFIANARLKAYIRSVHFVIDIENNNLAGNILNT